MHKCLAIANVLVQSCTISLLALNGAMGQIYLDPSQPLEDRIADLLPRLTTAQKAGQIYTGAPAIPELQIPAMNGWNQSLHGVVWNHPTTMFPVSIAMAATWDLGLVNQVASAIGDEARAINNGWKSGEITGNHNGLIYRSPVVDMGRDPRWGRNQEIWGEDTFLTSQMAVAYVTGMQGSDPTYLKTAATLKHVGVYNQETGRLSNNVVVSERFLREYYLPQFKAALVNGHAQSVMSSYNGINGTPNTINSRLLTDIIKNEWGFDGIQVPDTGAVHNLVTQFHVYSTDEQAAAAALLAGVDMDESTFPPALSAAFQDGLITEDDLDRALTRVLRIRFRLGEFDPASLVPYTQIPVSVIDSHESMALAMAQEAIVLLKNNGLLPLDSASIHSIAVLGPHANHFTAGDYSGQVSNPVTPLQGIRNRVPPGTTVNYMQGSSFSICTADGITAAANAARQSDVAVVYLGTDNALVMNDPSGWETEGHDRIGIGLPSCQVQLIQAVVAANSSTVVVYMNAGPVEDQWVDANVPAIVEGWWNGEQGGNAIADILFGNYNPGGKLPYTVYMSAAQVPPPTEYDISQGYTYMYLNGQPAYPFGHGLSYTEFQYSNLRIWPRWITTDGTLQVSMDVTNTGGRTGDEVVQVYTRYPASSIPRPTQQLVAFQRITLAPGESGHVQFQVPAANLAFYDESSAAFVVAPGRYQIEAGSSSADIRLTGPYTVGE